MRYFLPRALDSGGICGILLVEGIRSYDVLYVSFFSLSSGELELELGVRYFLWRGRCVYIAGLNEMMLCFPNTLVHL